MLRTRFSGGLRGTRYLTILLLASTAIWQAMSTIAIAESLPTPVIVISGNDIGLEKSGRIIDFAISPDNNRVTIAFVESERDSQLRLWLGEWDISTKKLIAKTQFAKPISASVASVGLLHRSMEYDAAGSEIILQAGNDVSAFQSSNLALRYSVSNSAVDSESTSGVFERLFAISADGNLLGVFSGQSEYPIDRTGTFSLYNAKTGAEISRWRLPSHIATLSLSPEGNRVLVTVFDQLDSGGDILLLDSRSGQIIKRYVSGFRQVHGRGASNSIFVDADHFVASPGSWVGAKGSYPGSSLQVFDANTGAVTATLTYDKFGSSGDIWVSSKDSVIAMLNVWMSGLKRRFNFNESGPKNVDLLFFHSTGGVPFCVVGPLPEKSDQPHQSGFIRFSADLGLAGLFRNDQVTLYPILAR